MMFATLAALILLWTFRAVLTQSQTPQKISVIRAEVGEDVTLTCAAESQHSFGLHRFGWHRFRFGFMLQTIVKGSYEDVKLTPEFANSRLNFTKWKDFYRLTISNVTQDDEGTYLCETGVSVVSKFVNKTDLKIVDRQKKHNHVQQGTIVEAACGPQIMTIVLGVLLAISLGVIAALVVSGRVCKDVRSARVPFETTDQTQCEDGESVHYAALNFPMKKSKRKQKTQECIYSETSTSVC